MNFLEILLLGVALGIDCCVVSFSQGLIFTSNRIRTSLMLAFVMGLFQGLMPFIGFVGAEGVSRYVEAFSHWLVFAIFLILGLKFIFESFQPQREVCCIHLKCLLAMGVATSIDALVAGASINFTGAPLLLSSLVIGIVSFVMSLAGFWSGNIFKRFPAQYLQILGGIILICLAFKAVL